MKVIIVGCAGGVTSSLLCKHIEKAGEKRNIVIKYEYLSEEGSLRMIEEVKSQGVNIFLIYCGASQINKYVIERIGDHVNGIYIAPQVRYLVPKLNKELANRSITCKSIDMRVFGLMDGDKMLDDILMF